MKRNVGSVDVKDKRVLVRLDLNVPLDAKQQITDDRRIRAALPTINRLIETGGRIILMSHLGRPKGGPDDAAKFSLAPVAERLSEILTMPVRLVKDITGDEATSVVDSLRRGDVCLLENLRFHKAETIKDKKAAEDPVLRERKNEFARRLAGLAEVYVNDAFGTCHRDNASMLTVPQMMEGKPRVVGFLVQRELDFLGGAVSKPTRPFVCVLGGAKVSDKLGVIRSLKEKCDRILIGGAMAYTFQAAEGVAVGKSLVEPDLYETARSLRADCGDKLMLPVDSVVATSRDATGDSQVCKGAIAEDMIGLDIGPQTIENYRSAIRGAKTVVWNGPMGVFETPPFDKGTLGVAQALVEATDAGATTIVGGGDSAAAMEKLGLADCVTHISTGGGASLEFLEGKRFAAIDVLDDASCAETVG